MPIRLIIIMQNYIKDKLVIGILALLMKLIEF